VFAGGGRGLGGTMEALTLTIARHEDARPLMTSSLMPAAARSQYLLDLLAQIPDPRKKRGVRHSLSGLLAAGVAAVVAGGRSFAAIGQWAGDAGPDVLAALGADRGPADESTFRRAFALVSADFLITSDKAADAATLAAWIQGHWHIENKLHWVRDVTYQEDKSLVRTGDAPRVMASLRSLAISLLRLDGHANIAAANRHHARDPQRTLKLLQTA
jgi:predicted transposase YbfD/YdcC